MPTTKAIAGPSAPYHLIMALRDGSSVAFSSAFDVDRFPMVSVNVDGREFALTPAQARHVADVAEAAVHRFPKTRASREVLPDVIMALRNTANQAEARK